MSAALPNDDFAPGYWQDLAHTPLFELLRKGPTGSLNWRHVLAEAELPAAAHAVIARVVRNARLWRAERVETTHELIAHFQDGLDAGAAADELVRDFGDAKTAAKLIRRAKRRCRPLWWQSWWWGSRTVTLLAAAYLAFGFYLMTGRPQVTVDYVAKLNAAALAAPENDRAWPIYERALLRLEEELGPLQSAEGFSLDRDYVPPHSRIGQQFFTESYEALTLEKRAELDEWLASHQWFLDALREAAAKPTMGIGIGPSNAFTPTQARLLRLGDPSIEYDANDLWHGSIASSMIPHQDLRAIGRFLDRDARRAVALGDAELAVKNLHALSDLSRQAAEPPTFICTLIGEAIQRMGMKIIAETLRHQPEFWNDEQLRDLAHLLARPGRSADHCLTGERWMYQDFLQRMYTDGGPGGGRLTVYGIRTYGEEIGLSDEVVYAARAFVNGPPGPNASPLAFSNTGSALLAAAQMPKVAVQVPWRSRASADGSAAYDQAARSVAAPLWERPEFVTDRLISHRDDASVLQVTSPSDRWISLRWNRLQGEIEGLLVAIALVLHHREHGEWPASLDDLAPRWLPAVPVDRINGGPVGYALVDGSPVVYSLGVDGDDDGGRFPGYMNDAENERIGYSTTREYRVGPPLTPKELRQARPNHYLGHDGDWVLWSTAAPRYVPRD